MRALKAVVKRKKQLGLRQSKLKKFGKIVAYDDKAKVKAREIVNKIKFD